MLAGFGVFALGRHHPVVRQAIHDVIDADLADLTQFDAPPLAGVLAERLLATTPHLDRVYFGNSGTEAVEAALKFARYATGRRRIVYCDHAFHGLTAGSLSVNGGQGIPPTASTRCCPTRRSRSGISTRCDANCEGRRRRLPHRTDPGQGRRGDARPGFYPPRQELLRQPQGAAHRGRGADRAGAHRRLLRLRARVACNRTWSRVAKALSGGYVPVGATLGRDWIFQKVYSSMDRVLVHDSTFGSNAQAMAAGLATLQVIEHEAVVANARTHGRPAAVTACRARRPIRTARRRSRSRPDDRHRVRPPLVAGDCAASWTGAAGGPQGPVRADDRARAALTSTGILTQVSGDHLEVIKLIPPLIIGEAEVDRFLTAFVVGDGRGTCRQRDDLGFRQVPDQAVARPLAELDAPIAGCDPSPIPALPILCDDLGLAVGPGLQVQDHDRTGRQTHIGDGNAREASTSVPDR